VQEGNREFIDLKIATLIEAVNNKEHSITLNLYAFPLSTSKDREVLSVFCFRITSNETIISPISVSLREQSVHYQV